MYCMSVEGCPPKQLGSFWKSSPSKQLPPTLNPTLFMGEALALSMPSTQRTRGSRIVSSNFQYLPHEVFWQSSFPPGGAKPWREFECMSPLQTTCALNVNLCVLLDSPEQTTRRQDDNNCRACGSRKLCSISPQRKTSKPRPKPTVFAKFAPFSDSKNKTCTKKEGPVLLRTTCTRDKIKPRT